MSLSSPVTHLKNNHAETKNFKTFVSTNPAALLVLPVNRQQGGDLRWGATPKESPTAMTSGRRFIPYPLLFGRRESEAAECREHSASRERV